MYTCRQHLLTNRSGILIASSSPGFPACALHAKAEGPGRQNHVQRPASMRAYWVVHTVSVQFYMGRHIYCMWLYLSGSLAIHVQQWTSWIAWGQGWDTDACRHKIGMFLLFFFFQSQFPQKWRSQLMKTLKTCKVRIRRSQPLNKILLNWVVDSLGLVDWNGRVGYLSSWSQSCVPWNILSTDMTIQQ